MKKLTTLAVLALVALTPLCAQTSRKDSAKAGKEAAVAAKTLKREGFKMVGLGDMQASLQQYIIKARGGCVEVVGTSEGCMSSNLAQLTAVNNAANMYAVNAGGAVRGRIVSTASSLTGKQVDEVVASFERLVLKDIHGELVPYVVVVKEKKGTYAARAYCLVDPQPSLRVRKLAIEAALEEQAMAEEYGSLISDWIDEGFEKAE